ncbi:MAG: FAD/NAD(P)-binding protein [Limnochordaceae bacterium]|nr:FAD/NAD(P)-binding protein [Limnochordaceae bacterium]
MQNLMTPRPAVIQRIRRQTADTLTYTLRFLEPEVQQAYRFSPGQFNEVSVFGVGEAPISISSAADTPDTFEHTVRAVGNVTAALARLMEGSQVGVRGPYGHGWPMQAMAGRNLLLIAGGIGLAPLRPVILEVMRHSDRYGSLEILYGARSPADLLFVDEYDVWTAHPQIRLLLSVDRLEPNPPPAVSFPGRDKGTDKAVEELIRRATVAVHRYDGRVGPVTVLFDQMMTLPAGTVVLTCGPEIMMKFVTLELMDRGFTCDQIYVSLERRMECGVAQCGHCQIGPLYVCKDGPVFNYKDVRYLPEAVF